MRSRTIREGSVGLLILVGVGLFGFLILWLRGIDLTNRSYRIFIEFAETGGLQTGAAVRYRGVQVGNVVGVRPRANRVEVEVEILDSSLLIPNGVLVEANQAGFLGDTSIDITPQEQLSEAVIADNRPLGRDCNSSIVVCNGDRLQGVVGVSLDKLIRSTVGLSEQFTDPELFANIQDLTRNSSDAAASVSALSNEVTTLVRLVREELGPLTDSARTVADSVSRAADQLTLTATETNDLILTNRAGLVTTLDNLNATSIRLRSVVDSIAPLAEEGEITRNLEDLSANIAAVSANAAIASANLRDVSNQLSDPTTLVMLQQTLDSARATFQNVQKITADLDELTGDPALRQDIRNLITGFSDLVSSTQKLEQQAQVAQTLPAAPASATVGLPETTIPIVENSGDWRDRYTPSTVESQPIDSRIDQRITMRPYTVTSRVGERVQVAFPVVRPVDAETSNTQ